MKDHAGKSRPVNVLFARDGYHVVLLHDSTLIIEKLFELLDEPERVIIVISWSWYVDDNKAINFRKLWERLIERFPQHAAAIRNNVIICMNSASEYARYRTHDPDARCILVNNTCFLATDVWGRNLTPLDQAAPGVMNAKCLYFKRHYLTTALPQKIFVSYNENADRKSPQYCDIRAYRPDQHFLNLSPESIADVYTGAAVGMALSELEGACYASTE